MLKNIILILMCSRVFSSPTTIFSWLVIFVYSIIDFGNIWYGILSLIGLCLVHFGVNLTDDYFDYKALIKQVGFDKNEYLKNSQKTKCRYLINSYMTENELLSIICIYFMLAALIGLFLFCKCGIGVLYFAFAGAMIAILYPFASRICLSELMVALAYGPALFGGVFYVMCGTYSKSVFLISVPTMIMTVILLYIHTVMDFEYDRHEGKKTIANVFNSQTESLIILKIMLILAYLAPVFLCIFDILDWQVSFVYLTIPLAIDLYKSMLEFSANPSVEPLHKWYHFPMENLEKLRLKDESAFMMRMYQSRNLMIYYSLLFTLAIICSLAI